jgi:hypothetical protein
LSAVFVLRPSVFRPEAIRGRHHYLGFLKKASSVFGSVSIRSREWRFALVVTVSLLLVLSLIAAGLLSLSTAAMRGSSPGAARAWCEAVVQRVTESHDPANDADVPARLLDFSGSFTDNSSLTEENRKLGRRFEVLGFRWFGADEV